MNAVSEASDDSEGSDASEGLGSLGEPRQARGASADPRYAATTCLGEREQYLVDRAAKTARVLERIEKRGRQSPD